VTFGAANIGVSGTGTLVVRDSGFATIGFFLNVGSFGTGTLVIDSGLVQSAAGTIAVDNAARGIATVDGSNSRWTNTGDLQVGELGHAELNILNGGQVSNSRGDIGGAASVVTVDGTGSKWSSSSDLSLGSPVASPNSGLLHIQNGGEVVNAAASLAIAESSTATVTVDGANSKWTSSGDLKVGEAGSASVSVTGGSRVTSNKGSLGVQKGSSGVMTVAGAGSIWSIGQHLEVGQAGRGSLVIESGGSVDALTANIGSPTTSAVAVDGAGSTLNVANGISVGSINGSATAAVTGGGLVTSTFTAVSAGPINGSVLIDGPGSRWSTTSQFLLSTGFFFDPGPGLVTVSDGGVLSAAGGMQIGPLGTVHGDGTIIANVVSNGTVAPGTSPGALHITGNYSQSSTGKLDLGIASSVSFDKLRITGNATLGGTLAVALESGYIPTGVRSFDVLDWTGSLTGTFSSIELPALGGSLAWDTSQLYTTGVLSVTGPVPPVSLGLFNLVQAGAAGPPFPAQPIVANVEAKLVPNNPTVPVERLKLSLFNAAGGQAPVAPLPIEVSAIAAQNTAALDVAFRLVSPNPIMPTESSFDLFFELEAHPDSGATPALIPTDPCASCSHVSEFDVPFEAFVSGVGTMQHVAHFEIQAGQPLVFDNVFIGPPQSPAFHVTFDLLTTEGEVMTGEDLFAVTLSAALVDADFDENGVVDGADLGTWQTGFGATGSATHAQGDADGDHDVDGGDFLAWQRQLGSSATAAETAGAPEPATLAMLAPAGIALSLRCRVARSRKPVCP
jgi:T5SS/PEP-CTERM-associated repeat protein